MSDKVKVAVRVRPFNSREIDLGTGLVVDMDETQTFLTHPTARDRKTNTKTFTFDHCFWSMDENNKKFADQEKVFRCLGTDVLANAFEGYNACIFAYGQTGSGKSYTMMGTPSQTGIIPRLCNELFDRIAGNTDENFSFKVEVSYIEIYNEKVRDLLNPRGGKQTLKVREHKVLGPYVDGLTKLVVSSFQDIDSLMVEGNKSRTVAATNMNSESSRSHAVFNIVLTQAEYDHETQTTGEKASKLSLVDLAGSERASKTGTTGDRLREGSNINKSLHTLGLVISALADQAASGKAKKSLFVPYRDSVLTWLLKDNLGGNSKTVMVATISPASDNYEETMSTLRYADRAKRIVNHAVVNEDPNAKIIRELREEVDRLKQILKMKGFSDSKDEIKEKLTESENLMEEFTMSWEEKEKNTEIIKQERHKALEEMGISIQSSGIAVEKSKFYLVNLNADPSLNELLVYYLKDHTAVGRPDAVHHTDIQLRGLGILPEHCVLDIIDNEVFLTPMPNARTCRNGVVVTEKTVLHHGDRILWGNNHFFRINCPRPPGAVNEPEQLVDYEFAQREICMNDLSSDISEDAMAVLEEKHKIDKEEALGKQRQMYEEKIERMKSEMSPAFRPERTVSLGSFSSGISSSRLSFNDELETLENERSLEKLKEEVVQANALVREANQLSEEMRRETEFTVTLQIPTSGLSLNRSRATCASEVAIVVKHKNKGTQFWSLDKLSNKIYDMRDTYNQIEEGNLSKEDGDDDLFFEVECHTLIGVANVYLECIFLDVPLDYAAPIISQQGEVCGRLKVELTRVLENEMKEADAGSLSDGENRDEMNDNENEPLGIPDHNEEISIGQTIAVKVKIIEAYDLPPAFCNYVFCQYEFWDQPNVVELSSPGSKSNAVVFTEEQVFRFEATEEFLEYISEGALSIEIWGNRSKGFGQTSWTPNIQPIAADSDDGWNDLKRKVDLWVEIHELNDQGVFSPVELTSRTDNETGGIFQLRQGQSRRIVVGVRPLPKTGSLPVVIETISAIEVGSVSRCSKSERSLDSYQDKDLSALREKLSNSLMKKREYLDEQIQLVMSKKDKSTEDKDRESWLIDQWVNLTEEKNFLLHPQPGTNVPGAPRQGHPPPGMEENVPVIFLDLNAEGLHTTSVDESKVAGLRSTLAFEADEEMKELPTFKYDQKNVAITVLWDSSVHDSVYLNRATSSSERVYLIIKAHVRLSSPLAMDLILRKRVCVRIYKRQSLKDSIMKRIWKELQTRCGVTYELVSHIPRQPGEETEERGTLAEKAAAAVSADDEEHEIVLEKYHRGISHVEGLLKLDKLRQEVVVKEKLAASGKPLRKFASTPNLLQGSFDLSSVGTKNNSLDVDFGQGYLKKESPGQRIRQVQVSFDDWDKPPTETDCTVLVPTIVTSTPAKTLETVQEQSTPSSPICPGKIMETSFPYNPEKTNHGVVRSLELELKEEKESPVPPPEEKEPSESDPLGNFPVICEPLGSLSSTSKLVEFPIEVDSLNLENSGLDNEETAVESDDILSDANARQVAVRTSGFSDSTTSLSNSVDSGLHESTDQLLSQDNKEQGDRGRENLERDLIKDMSSGRNRTPSDSDGSTELKIGQVITVGDSKVGLIRYIGATEFASGEWVGVELELPVGKNDGSVNGKRYFKCKPKFGTFVRADKITLPSTRTNSSTSSRVITTKQSRRVLGGTTGGLSPSIRTNSPLSRTSEGSKHKVNNTSNSADQKQKEMNRRSNILF